jgi:hypothetical protein
MPTKVRDSVADRWDARFLTKIVAADHAVQVFDRLPSVGERVCFYDEPGVAYTLQSISIRKLWFFRRFNILAVVPRWRAKLVYVRCGLEE